MDYKEIKYNQKIVKKHQVAYSVGKYSDAENSYMVSSENWMAFNLGRVARGQERARNDQTKN
ncbi:MAG: hypothetical protein M0R17_04205 [Candidatus Omnitrophica bacterium]|jgi:hypothetical protein|nr:hypothetical protein [Candidatus Omnitrophota bacterium]